MSKIDDGGPVIAVIRSSLTGRFEDVAGLSLRDYLAAHAPAYPFKLPDIFPGRDTNPDQKIGAEIAAWRYAYADAMISQRQKGEST